MRFVASTGSGRTLVFGDEPERGELSPVETLAVALAACSAMDVVSILDKKRQVYDTYRVDVRAEQRDEYPQVFTRIDVTHIVEGTVVLDAAVRRSVDALPRMNGCEPSAWKRNSWSSTPTGDRCRWVPTPWKWPLAEARARRRRSTTAPTPTATSSRPPTSCPR